MNMNNVNGFLSRVGNSRSNAVALYAVARSMLLYFLQKQCLSPKFPGITHKKESPRRVYGVECFVCSFRLRLLKKYWDPNVLFSLIHFFSLIEKVIKSGNYLTIIRAFRVLRPLRAINKVPSKWLLYSLIYCFWFNAPPLIKGLASIWRFASYKRALAIWCCRNAALVFKMWRPMCSLCLFSSSLRWRVGYLLVQAFTVSAITRVVHVWKEICEKFRKYTSRVLESYEVAVS